MTTDVPISTEASMHGATFHLPKLIQRMLDPTFYPHPIVKPITLIQTHISYVLLTGDFAYKVKKPVKLSFLDFSTLECRRHFCEEEIRLNGRGASGIYLHVAALHQTENEFHLGGGGTIVEYAVIMRQFPQDSMARDMLALGTLQPEQVEALAGLIAHYHAEAHSSGHIAQFGAPDLIREGIEDNYGDIQQAIIGPRMRQMVQNIKSFTDLFFAARQLLFESRRARGYIRECHGDLHLGNICFWGEKILLFDCIEFNESFRCIDVIQDAAFVAMDLEASGRKDLATLFVNSYAEQTGDWEGLQLLRLHLCRHACVRAKVNALLLNEPEFAAADKDAARKNVESYLSFAGRHAQTRQGRLILMMGLSGSGKSTLARRLAQQCGAIHIRSDAVRKHLVGVPLDQKGAPSIYAAAVTDRTYARLLDLGLLLTHQGYTVILDARYGRRALRHHVLARTRAERTSLHILNCTAPYPILLDRLAARTGDISDAGPELLERQYGEFESFDDMERPVVTTVDTTQSPACNMCNIASTTGLDVSSPMGA